MSLDLLKNLNKLSVEVIEKNVDRISMYVWHQETMIIVKSEIEGKDVNIKFKEKDLLDDDICIELCKKNNSMRMLKVIERTNINFFNKRENILEILKENFIPFVIIENMDKEIASLWIKRGVDEEDRNLHIRVLGFIKNFPKSIVLDEGFILSIGNEVDYLKLNYGYIENVSNIAKIYEFLKKRQERENFLEDKLSHVNKVDIVTKKHKI